MSIEDIKGKIIGCLEESSGLDKEEISKVCNLISDEIIDSLGMIELISYLEKEFNIIFSEDDLVLDNFETIDQATNGKIKDGHWSWKGQKQMADYILKMIKDNRYIKQDSI